MKTSVEHLNPTHAKLTITVSPEEFRPALDKAYGEIAKQINIPGFRRGKVRPEMIDMRVGRAAVIEQAVGESVDGYFRQAIAEEDIEPLGRPSVTDTTVPGEDLKDDLVLVVEMDVRPEVTLPTFDTLKVEVEPSELTDDDVQTELDSLRARFGSLNPVDRPIKDGDFVTIDLIASIDGEEVDKAEGISYEVGSGQLLEGIDEALDTLTEGEETTFRSTLLGGEHQGKEAEIAVTVQNVKERELPEADDEFAQMASEFDTLEELREDLKKQAAKRKLHEQVDEARVKAIEELEKAVEVPLPENFIDEQVEEQSQQRGEMSDEDKQELRKEIENAFRRQVILDTIVESEGVTVEQDEFTQFIVQTAQQYGMAPQEFANLAQRTGQLQQMVGEVARMKALLFVLDGAEIKDTNGEAVDVSEFTAPLREARDKAAQESDESAEEEASVTSTETFDAAELADGEAKA